MKNHILHLVVASLTVGALCGCGDDSGPRRTTFPVDVVASTATGLTNDFGYTVDIQQARMRLGPITCYSGEPLFTQSEPTWRRWLAKLWPVGTAHAHPCHYQEGQALAELTCSHEVDLLASSTRLGTASGVTGSYRSVRVDLSKASGNPTVTIQGKATKSNSSISFSASLSPDTAVKGVALNAEVDGRPGTLALRVDLKSWVDHVDFSKLSGAAPVTVASGSQAENALVRGITSTSAFQFTWKPSGS